MPRIYSTVQDHTSDWPAIPFIEGAAAVPQGTNTTHLAADGYSIDGSKHALTVPDRLPKAQVQILLACQGISFLAGDSKQALVRKLETAISTAKLTALTIASVAGTALGDSKITVTGALGTEGNTLAFQTGPDPVAVLYKDVPGTDYTTFASGADITPDTAGDDTIMVIERNAAGEVLSYGTHALTVRTV